MLRVLSYYFFTPVVDAFHHVYSGEESGEVLVQLLLLSLVSLGSCIRDARRQPLSLSCRGDGFSERTHFSSMLVFKLRKIVLVVLVAVWQLLSNLPYFTTRVYVALFRGHLRRVVIVSGT